MRELKTPYKDWDCERCHKLFPEGSILYSCQACDCNECPSCHSKGVSVEDGTKCNPKVLELDAVLINLEHRSDRLEAARERLRERCPWLMWRRQVAVDGRRQHIPIEAVKKMWNTGKNDSYIKIYSAYQGTDPGPDAPARTLRLSKGERGCAMSHIHAWQHCVGRPGAMASGRPLLS